MKRKKWELVEYKLKFSINCILYLSSYKERQKNYNTNIPHETINSLIEFKISLVTPEALLKLVVVELPIKVPYFFSFLSQHD